MRSARLRLPASGPVIAASKKRSLCRNQGGLGPANSPHRLQLLVHDLGSVVVIAAPTHDDLVFAVVLDERNVQPPLRIALCHNFHQYFLEHRHVVALQKSSIAVLMNRWVTVPAKRGRVGKIDSTFHSVSARLKPLALSVVCERSQLQICPALREFFPEKLTESAGSNTHRNQVDKIPIKYLTL